MKIMFVSGDITKDFHDKELVDYLLVLYIIFYVLSHNEPSVNAYPSFNIARIVPVLWSIMIQVSTLWEIIVLIVKCIFKEMF